MKSVLFLLATLTLTGIATAQPITSSIVGSVVDGTNLPVAAATVTLTHLATGAERRTQTDERGDFVLPSLQRGDYIVSHREQPMALRALGVHQFELALGVRLYLLMHSDQSVAEVHRLPLQPE